MLPHSSTELQETQANSQPSSFSGTPSVELVHAPTFSQPLDLHSTDQSPPQLLDSDNVPSTDHPEASLDQTTPVPLLSTFQPLLSQNLYGVLWTQSALFIP